jgi:hypothetical protein
VHGLNVNTTAEFPAESISLRDWVWVQDLIQEVQRQQIGEAFARKFWEWDLAVRLFRKVEFRRMVLASPSEADLLWHAACLHALLAMGNLLLLEARKLSLSEMESFGLRHEQLDAYVAELDQNFREWHHGMSETELTAARQKIFGVAA